MKINSFIQKYDIGTNKSQNNKSTICSSVQGKPEKKATLMTSNGYYNMQQCRLSFASSLLMNAVFM